MHKYLSLIQNFLRKIPESGLGIPTDRDQQSLVFPNNPKSTLPLKENPKKYFLKSKTLKNTLFKQKFIKQKLTTI